MKLRTSSQPIDTSICKCTLFYRKCRAAQHRPTTAVTGMWKGEIFAAYAPNM